MNLSTALKTLNLKSAPDLQTLKSAYRQQMRKWHPDLNPGRLKKATEQTQRINAAYDFLERLASGQKGSAEDWSKHVYANINRWRKEFREQWAIAHQRSVACQKIGEMGAGLHYNTCIENFRRAHTMPPKEWFVGALYPDGSDECKVAFREHLLKVAPNQKMREEWARKYYALEFGEGVWTFYLPPFKELLRPVNQEVTA